MIKHLIKIIWEQRRSNVLLWMELLLVSVLLWMVTDKLYTFYLDYSTPKGFEVENTYYVSISMIPGREKVGNASTDSLQKAYEEPFTFILDRIRRNPNVEHVSASEFSRPYNGGNRHSDVINGEKRLNSYIRYVDPTFFKVFQIPIIAGRPLNGGVGNEIVLSRSIADSLFGTYTKAVGRTCVINEEKLLVVGVTAPYKYYDFAGDTPTSYQQFATHFRNNLGWVDVPEVCVRFKDNAPKDAADQLRKELSNLGDSPYYFRDITSFEDLRNVYLGWTGEIKIIKISAAIIIFFLVNVLVGIVGTFWFRTEQRRNEIGLRMAIGSTEQSIRKFFIVESLLMMLFAAFLAILIALQLRIFGIHLFGYWNWKWCVFICSGFTAFLILGAMVVLGIWIPVRKASKIQPSEALHYE